MIHVLHIEDSPIYRYLVAEHLSERAGEFSVSEAATLGRALEVLPAFAEIIDPRAVVLDLRLPDAVGRRDSDTYLQVRRLVRPIERRLERSLPIIVVSDTEEPGAAARIRNLGGLLHGKGDADSLAQCIRDAVATAPGVDSEDTQRLVDRGRRALDMTSQYLDLAGEALSDPPPPGVPDEHR